MQGSGFWVLGPLPNPSLVWVPVTGLCSQCCSDGLFILFCIFCCFVFFPSCIQRQPSANRIQKERCVPTKRESSRSPNEAIQIHLIVQLRKYWIIQRDNSFTCVDCFCTVGSGDDDKGKPQDDSDILGSLFYSDL